MTGLTCNPSGKGVKSGESEVQGQPQQHEFQTNLGYRKPCLNSHPQESKLTSYSFRGCLLAGSQILGQPLWALLLPSSPLPLCVLPKPQVSLGWGFANVNRQSQHLKIFKTLPYNDMLFLVLQGHTLYLMPCEPPSSGDKDREHCTEISLAVSGWIWELFSTQELFFNVVTLSLKR